MNKEKIIEKIDKLLNGTYSEGSWEVSLIRDGINEVKDIIQSEPEENIHDIIYDFITQYDDKIGLAIATQDYELLNICIKDYLCEPFKEKTNLDVITESPEKLAEFIIEVQNDTKNGQEWLIDEHCVGYLNQKAGE